MMSYRALLYIMTYASLTVAVYALYNNMFFVFHVSFYLNKENFVSE